MYKQSYLFFAPGFPILLVYESDLIDALGTIGRRIADRIKHKHELVQV